MVRSIRALQTRDIIAEMKLPVKHFYLTGKCFFADSVRMNAAAGERTAAIGSEPAKIRQLPQSHHRRSPNDEPAPPKRRLKCGDSFRLLRRHLPQTHPKKILRLFLGTPGEEPRRLTFAVLPKSLSRAGFPCASSQRSKFRKPLRSSRLCFDARFLAR